MGFSLVFSFLLYTRLFHTANCKKEVKRLKEVERLSKVSPSNQEVVFFFFTFFLCKTHRLLMESFTHLTPNQFFEDVKVEVSSLKFGEPLE